MSEVVSWQEAERLVPKHTTCMHHASNYHVAKQGDDLGGVTHIRCNDVKMLHSVFQSTPLRKEPRAPCYKHDASCALNEKRRRDSRPKTT
jgi:hypothetical protein